MRCDLFVWRDHIPMIKSAFLCHIHLYRHRIGLKCDNCLALKSVVFINGNFYCGFVCFTDTTLRNIDRITHIRQIPVYNAKRWTYSIWWKIRGGRHNRKIHKNTLFQCGLLLWQTALKKRRSCHTSVIILYRKMIFLSILFVRFGYIHKDACCSLYNLPALSVLRIKFKKRYK